MKKLILFGAAISISVAISAQHVALKNNLLYDATTTPNLALEIGLGKKTTLDLYGGYNPFTLGEQAFQALAGTAGISLLDLRTFQWDLLGTTPAWG